MKCSLGRCRDAKSEEVPFCMGCYAPNQIRSNGIGREHERQFISSVRSHPDRTPLSRIRGRSELYPRSEDQGCETRPDRRSSLHIHHAHIEFDERLRGMVEESRGQKTDRILAERRVLAEDPQQGHNHIEREPRRHHSPTVDGHQMRIFQAGIGPANDSEGGSRQIPSQSGRRASDLVPQAHNGDQADPGLEQGFGGRLHDPSPSYRRRPSLWPAIAYQHRGTAEGGSRGDDRGGWDACQEAQALDGIMIRSPSHLTLTRFRNGKGPLKEVLSNWDPISQAVFDDIRLHESPEWGSRKVASC